MHVALRTRVAVFAGMVLTTAGCGGGTRGRAWPPRGPPPGVVKPLPGPHSPLSLLHFPPVKLAAPPDPTAHGRKPRGHRPTAVWDLKTHARQAARGEVAVASGAVQPGPLPRSLPAPALRWGPPARRPGPRPRARSEGLSVGRAPGQPRRQAAQHGPGRPEAVPAPDPDHHGVRDARPGGGDGTRRPHRGHGAREGATNRNASGGL